MAKVTACNADEGQCVEVEVLSNGEVAVTDSKETEIIGREDYVMLRFNRKEWDEFTDAVKEGKFDYDQLVAHSHATPAALSNADGGMLQPEEDPSVPSTPTVFGPSGMKRTWV